MPYSWIRVVCANSGIAVRLKDGSTPSCQPRSQFQEFPMSFRVSKLMCHVVFILYPFEGVICAVGLDICIDLTVRLPSSARRTYRCLPKSVQPRPLFCCHNPPRFRKDFKNMSMHNAEYIYEIPLVELTTAAKKINIHNLHLLKHPT
ncbi:hypothetical protein BO82DRAFT_181087 [Aspergillus uvarum CBS 121591]|uniref:Uncharacterized protein n=1 Tax=Aspergillus uvarum CBS 121591 TaxID=1448315 RepID=A0A319BUM0_9EURO|nr:hypothetical protein BO82DRAFT_181087 [Aspergillus uvarum CBS 121591]PYH77376.1 hypothetical protein BO82DRAFT_181087 [Aspergillus uvarum CBS 121591]